MFAGLSPCREDKGENRDIRQCHPEDREELVPVGSQHQEGSVDKFEVVGILHAASDMRLRYLKKRGIFHVFLAPDPCRSLPCLLLTQILLEVEISQTTLLAKLADDGEA